MSETREFRSWALALTATSTMAVSYFDRQTLAAIAPTVTKELGISEAAYGWLGSAFSLSYLVAAPLAGRVLDRVGARRGLLASVLAWSAVAAAHALVPGFVAIFALRIALGIAEAPSFPGAAQTIHRALPPSERARGFGILFTGSSFGAMLAPIVATKLTAWFSWRVAFVGTALVGLLWVPLWLDVAYSDRAKQALDAPPQDETPGEKPSLREVLAHPAVLRLMALVFASAPFIALVLNFGAKYLVRDHHLSQEEVGPYLVVPPLLFDFGAIAFGWLANRARQRGAIGVPRPLVAAAMLLAPTGAAVPFAGSAWGSIAVASVAMAGGAGLYALALVDATARVSPEFVSTVGGMGAFAQSLAHIAFGPIIGWSVARQQSYTPALVGLALFVVPGAAVWLAWVPNRKHAAASG
jgi:ACS family hexuronate transporter-like MFS transporter